MLSSQQRLLLRVARRKLPSRSSLLYRHHQQEQHGNSLSALSSNFFHSTSYNQKEDDTPTTTRGMPLIHPSSLSSWNTSSTTTMLARSHPWGLTSTSSSHHHHRWFSTEAETNKNSTTYKERAAHYRERAHHYSDEAKAGAKSFGGMMKLYGPAFVGTYLTVYVATLGGLYVGVESGALDPVILLGYVTGNHEEIRSSAEVVAELLEHYTLTESFAETVRQKPSLANLAVAWISTKFTEPLRLAATAAVVPRVARYFGIGPHAKKDGAIIDGEEEFESSSDAEATKVDNPLKTEEKSEEKKL